MKVEKAQIIDEYIPDGHSFAVFHEICDEYAFLWHYHPTCEIFFPLRGNGRCIIGNRLGNFSAGDIIYAGEGLPHVFYTIDRKISGYEFYKIHFPFSFFAKMRELFPEANNLLQKFSFFQEGIRFNGDTRYAFRLIKKLYRSYRVGDKRSLGIFIELLADLSENKSIQEFYHSVNLAEGVSFNLARLQKICNYLHRNFLNQIRLDELANFAGMSKSNLCAFFKQSTNTSIIDYVNRLRIDKACSLLLNTDDRISDIAFKSGYKTLSHFNREFLKFRGRSPKDLRRES